jgi:hypothetical protein
MDALPPAPPTDKKGASSRTYRGGREFEVLYNNATERTSGFVYEARHSNEQEGTFFSKVCRSMTSTAKLEAQCEDAPDIDFCANTLVKLTHGVTAYRLIEPSTAVDEDAHLIPLVVCLHDLTSCSYMWGDVADLLADCEQGPQARVLVLDFYGRGRSPWTGVQCTLDVLVMQVKELLEC